MTLHINDNGIWKTNDPHVNDGGIVKPVNTGYVNENGIWKEMHSAVPTVIGQFSQGGYYFGDIDEHRLICAPIEGEAILMWGPDAYDFPNPPRSDSDGYYNTQIILNAPGTYPAAEFCNDLIIDGFSDWYLPAKDEMYLIYQNKDVLEEAELKEGIYYWTSTESQAPANNYAWGIRLSIGYANPQRRTRELPARAIRRWTP